MLFICFNSSRAIDKIDSLSQVLTIQEKEGDELGTIMTLKKLGEAYHNNGQYREAFKQYQRGLEQSLQTGPKEEEVRLKIKMAIELFWIDEYRDALQYYSQALEDKEWLTPKEVANLQSNIAENYMFWGDYAKAATHQYEGLIISESINDSSGIAHGHLILSSIFSYSDQLEKAIEEGQKAYESHKMYYPDVKDSRLYNILASLGDVHHKLGNLKEAEGFFKQSLSLAEEINNGYGVAFSNGLLGEIAYSKGEYDSSEVYLLKAISYFQEKGLRNEQANYQDQLGETYIQQKKLGKAISVLNEALAAAKNIESTDIEKDVYEKLAISYAEKGEYQSSNRYLQKFMALKDSIVGEANQKEVTALREQYEIQKREKEIEMLKNEGEQRQNKLYLFGILIGLGFFLVILWLLLSRYREKANRNDVLIKKNEEIAHQNKQLSSLNEDLLKFSEIVSKDLQDSLQHINEVCMNMRKNLTVNGEQIDSIQANLKDIEGVLYGLIMYSMTGSKEDMFELCDSKELVTQALQELPSHTRNNSSKISLHTLPKVLANRNKLSQLFSYLVSYSLQHQENEYSRIEISGKEKVDEYEFIIQNDGPVIPEEKASSIFKLASNEDSSDYSAVELAVSRKIVEQHKGKIWVETREDLGTSFHFTIPKQKELLTV